MYPREMPDLFRGDQLVIFGTYSKAGNGAITVTGTADGKEQKFAQDVTFEASTDKSREWIAKLWATRRVGFLLDEIRRHGESKELKDEVVELARQWGIVTPYTAMLIIEDEKQRGIPVAQRSLREMEHDRTATRASKDNMDSMKKSEVVGRRAVGSSIASATAKGATSVERAQGSFEQKEARERVGNESGKADLDNGGSIAALPATQPGAAPTYYGRVGGEKAADLNLGTSSVSGWQNGSNVSGVATPVADQGYRVVTNYAQQTRVVNNRAFYLNGNQWTDSTVQKKLDAKPTKIVFNSEAYFSLLKQHPEAAQYLSLGTNVTVELGGMVYDIVEEPVEAPTAK
jgi:Ca-activated chloride channel family protein